MHEKSENQEFGEFVKQIILQKCTDYFFAVVNFWIKVITFFERLLLQLNVAIDKNKFDLRHKRIIK